MLGEDLNIDELNTQIQKFKKASTLNKLIALLEEEYIDLNNTTFPEDGSKPVIVNRQSNQEPDPEVLPLKEKRRARL